MATRMKTSQLREATETLKKVMAIEMAGGFVHDVQGCSLDGTREYTRLFGDFDGALGVLSSGIVQILAKPKLATPASLNKIRTDLETIVSLKSQLDVSEGIRLLIEHPPSIGAIEEYRFSRHTQWPNLLETHAEMLAKSRDVPLPALLSGFPLRQVDSLMEMYLVVSSRLETFIKDFSPITNLLERAEPLTRTDSAVFGLYLSDLRKGFEQVLDSPLSEYLFFKRALENPQAFNDVLYSMDHLLPGYHALDNASGVRIHDLLKADKSRPFSTNNVGEGVAVISDRGSSLAEAAELLMRSPAETRWEIFDVLTRYDFLPLYHLLRKNGMSAGAFSNAIIEIAEATPEQRRPIMEWFANIANPETKISRDAIALVLEKPWRISRDPRFEDILSTLQDYSLGYVVVGDYLSAGDHGEHRKASLYLDLAFGSPKPQYLKHLRMKVREASDESIERVLSLPVHEREKHILRLSAAFRNTSSKIQNTNGTTWGAYLKERVRAQMPELASSVTETYDFLSKETKRRLRSAWDCGPVALEKFCDDVKEFRTLPSFGFVLANGAVFEKYLDMLTEGDVSYRNSLRALNGNAPQFRQMLSIFSPIEQSNAGSLEMSSEEKSISPISYRRVIVWGGRYDTHREERLQEKFDIPILMFHYSGHMPRPQEVIQQDDLVVFVTSVSTHHDYFDAKAVAKRVGAEFRHTCHENIDLIAQAIRNA